MLFRSGGEGEGEGEGEGGGGGNPCVNAVAGWSWVACVEGEDCIMKCVYSDTKYFRVGINPCPEDPDVVVTPAFTNTNYISNILFSITSLFHFFTCFLCLFLHPLILTSLVIHHKVLYS